ncbi:Nuclear cap-binding protein subunit 1 [Termitomyces sp. T112]|nr:Nuclear cap-binding protein subunit 1 [Termitomyces sp. T112]KAH0586929.1 hypothetical protein H2248_005763 [Termitomyces sp. 'cryptogamus']
MSYNERRGGYRRRHRDEYDDRRRETYETPEDKLKTAILKLGEVDAVEELPRLQKQIQEIVPANVALLSESIRIGVTEQPYKVPYYAALIRLLHEPPADVVDAESKPSLGRLVLEDFWKGFQTYLDKLEWRETRLCIQFFAHLTVAGIISSESMVSLLQAFTAVLDGFNVSHKRAKRAALCAAEGLMISGASLKTYSQTSVSEIISAIQTFSDTTAIPKWLVRPTSSLYTDAVTIENGDEMLDTILQTLQTLNDSDFAQVADSFPQPYLAFTKFDNLAPFNLPLVLVPPETEIELDGVANNTEEAAQIKKDEWPEYYLRLFDNDVSPNPNTPAGYAVRTALLDIISIFDVNRKECARLLLEYPKWNLPGAFKPKPGAPVDVEPALGKYWQLESTILEIILGTLLILPESSQRSIYYISLITELCKLSPSTVGPAVGKSIRKLYAALSEGLDVEAARRFAEWFSIHMSNFGFQWVWKEWVPDLALSVQHPKRTFMRRAVEFEIRLSYYDRILKTLPEPMQSPVALIIAEQAPGPYFEYDDTTNPHHEAAQGVLNLFRGRAKAEDVINHLETLKNTLETSENGPINVDATTCSIVIQSLLHIGSRSFSHLLNAIERYLPLLRNVAGSSNVLAAAEAKAGILTSAAIFWKNNPQMVGIVFDKLMQYQIVDPNDVVGWTFTSGSGLGLGGQFSLSAFEWDLVRGALDKANGRVLIARRKVTALRKEEDDTRARVKAKANESMEVDADTKPEDETTVENPAMTTALKALDSLTAEQKSGLSRTLEGFVACLTQSSFAPTVITDQAWHNRANWDDDDWNAWETWGWYRQFCRAYSPYLREYAQTLYTISFSKFETSTDPAAELLKKIWNAATDAA